MAEPTIVIAGGSGVFGSVLAKEILSSTPARLILTGRHLGRLEAARRRLPFADRATAKRLDLEHAENFSREISGAFAVVCAAGPFRSLSPGLPGAAMRAGCHWLDLSDDRQWVTALLANSVLSIAARKAGVAILPGLSTVPALSGFLVRSCRERLPDARRARVTLWIGNRNPKGAGAIESALHSLQAGAEPVETPLGRVAAYRFDSPDRELLKQELDLDAEFRTGFEWKAAGQLAVLAAGISRRTGRGMAARWLSRLAAPFSRFGTDKGLLQAELWDAKGGRVSASLVAQGQRLAILPSLLALEALLAGSLTGRGVVHPAAWLSPRDWAARLSEKGAELLC
jgi:short subunit dehydrogenase-like uncharacterized protein